MKEFISRRQALLSSIIIVMSLVVVVLVELPGLTQEIITGLIIGDFLFCSYFWVEYIAGIVRADDKKKYAAYHFVDVVGAIPTAYALRWFRVVRLLRLLKLLRVAALFNRLWRLWIKALRLAPATTLAVYSAAMVFLGGSAFYLTEQGANEKVVTYGDAVWLTLVTLTTVGYGDVYPVTPAGRWVGMILAILGIGFVAALTGTIAGSLLDSLHTKEEEQKEVA
jgi:voltage-gated potassium channel